MKLRLLAPLLAIVAALQVTGVGPASASITVREYLDIKLGRREGVDSSVLYVYVWGVLDALLVANQVADTYGTVKLFCEPEEDIELSVDEFKAMVDEELEKMRLERDFEARAEEMTVGQLALVTLADRFPCE